MKSACTIIILLLMSQFSFSNSFICPDPPENDSPCISDVNPPIDLSGGGFHEGTTCCATLDFENEQCGMPSDGASVWYIFNPAQDSDGIDITLENVEAEGPLSIEVFKGTSDAGCTANLELIESACNTTGEVIKLGNCFSEDEVIFVKVSTSELDENCGSFDLSITPASCGEMADNCFELADHEPMEPITDTGFGISYDCASGCLTYACPESDTLGGCTEFNEMPTVWFQVVTDDIAAQMFTTVETNGNWEAVWTVYSGPDCDNLTVVDFGGSPPCSNGDNTPDLHQTSVFDSEENYWISVTVDPASLPSTGLDDGSFELCVATTINAIICLGELEGGACEEESLVIEVTERELENLPLDGPFVQGEEVTVNVSFFYDATESGADWLIGFVPIFGAGWDLSNFDFDMNAPTGNGQTSQWYEEGGICAPILQEPNPILCTYVNDDGNLELCNLLCSPCSECPQNFMEEGDPLPSGYFWVTNGSNTGCENDCSPGEGWGIGASTAQIDWTFTLKVKVFDNEDDCFNKNDLSISFQTFSDGAAGCWEDPVGECLLDRAMIGPAWKVECETPPEVVGNDQEICHNGTTDILVQTADGSTSIIMVEVEDNPNVTGEKNYTFMTGVGTIQDTLENLTDNVQKVLYSAFIDDPTLPSLGAVTEIEVTVYPELKATFPPVYVCDSTCTDIAPDIEGGFGPPYTYLWSTGEITNPITVCPVVPTTYFVTVEDGLGCTGIAEVQVDVKPSVELLLPESIDVIIDDSFDPFDPDYIVCVELIGGTTPFSINWSSSPAGLVGISSGIAGECYAINEEASLEMNGNGGQYTLTASVTDFFGCMNEESTMVNVKADSTVNVFDEELFHKVNINPNPSNDVFNISVNTSEKVDYTIRDLVGREVMRGTISDFNKSVNLGDQPKGIYLLILKDAKLKKSAFHKLLKI